MRRIGSYFGLALTAIVTIAAGIAVVLFVVWVWAQLINPGHVWGQPVWVEAREWLRPTETSARLVAPPTTLRDAFDIARCSEYEGEAIIDFGESLEQSDCVYVEFIVDSTSTPEPSLTPKSKSTPIPFHPKPTKVIESGFSLAQGDIEDIATGWGCFGDLDLWTGVDWYSPYLYEADLDHTGQIVIFTNDARVKAAHPGSCTPNGNADTMSNSLRQNGCIDGCMYVNVVYWPHN